jgi:hypothetical protein
MTLDEFWDHVRASRRKEPRAHAKLLTQRLSKLKPDEIVDFDHWWHTLLRESYDWDLWGAAYLINGGCSDDGFEYFREWLLLQGRDVFQAAVTNPDSLADVVDTEKDHFECECYPGREAWFVATGTKRDDAGYKAWDDAQKARHPDRGRYPALNRDWKFGDDEEVGRRFPRLAALYLNRE